MTCQVADLVSRARAIESGRTLTLGGVRPIGYDPSTDLVLHRTMSLPFHPNGLRFTAVLADGTETSET